MARRRQMLFLMCGALSGGYANLATAQQKEIVIGVATAMTGPGAATGQQIAAGADLAVKEANAAGGIKGAKVKLIIEDDRTQPGGAVNAFNKLASSKPAIVLGPTWTNFMLTLAPIIKRTEIPVFTSATGAKVTDPDVSGGWIFRAAPSMGTIIHSLIEYATKSIAPKRAAIMYSNDEWGKSGYEAFKSAGIQFVAEETFNFGDKDVSAQVLKLKEARPDAIILWPSVPADAGLITNQVRQFLPDVRIIGSPAFAVDEYYQLAKKGSEGVVTVAPWVPGLTPLSAEWEKNFKANDPKATVSYTGAESYDAAKIAIMVLTNAPNLEPASVRKALYNVKDYNGVVGKYSFDERGDGLHSAAVVVWTGGEMKPVKRGE